MSGLGFGHPHILCSLLLKGSFVPLTKRHPTPHWDHLLRTDITSDDSDDRAILTHNSFSFPLPLRETKPVHFCVEPELTCTLSVRSNSSPVAAYTKTLTRQIAAECEIYDLSGSLSIMCIVGIDLHVYRQACACEERHDAA